MSDLLRSSAKSTWWPSNSGPSTQTNLVVFPTVIRQQPHMPVPSTMSEFRLTRVGMPSVRVISQTALIITPGPMATTRSTGPSSAIKRRSSSVTNPWRPSVPSSVVMNSSSLRARISCSRINISLVLAPMIERMRFPAALKALVIG